MQRLEIKKMLDRRQDRRYYPKNMFIEISAEKNKEKLKVDNISVEGVRVIFSQNTSFKEKDKVDVHMPELECPLKGEVQEVEENSLRIHFTRDERISEILETIFLSFK